MQGLVKGAVPYTSPLRNKMMTFRGRRNRKNRWIPLCERLDRPVIEASGLPRPDADGIDARRERSGMDERRTPQEEAQSASGRAAIVVWRLRTGHGEANVRSLRPLLSHDERQRADRLRVPAARARFIVTRATLRLLLADRTGIGPSALRLVSSPEGKPSLHHDDGLLPFFSVSHAGDMALIALSDAGCVGVDVEQIRDVRRLERIAARLFDRSTCRLLDSLAPVERQNAFLHAWTQREAFVKAVGGRLFGTDDPLTFRWPRQALAVQPGRGNTRWTVAPLEPGAGYAATVVAAGVAGTVSVLDIEPGTLAAGPGTDRRSM